MNNKVDELRARLQELGKQIDRAEEKLKLAQPISLDHKITNAELRARYNVLRQEIGETEGDLEAHGRHVGELEHSIRLWLTNIDAGGV
jgi:chromosome segregation ATPase